MITEILLVEDGLFSFSGEGEDRPNFVLAM